VTRTRSYSWFSSLWVVDGDIVEREITRTRPGWSTACGPLTVVCRSSMARDRLLSTLREASDGADVRLATDRAQMALELARFAASNTMPYVHLVPGSFDYEPDAARVLGMALDRTLPAAALVDCACRIGEAYAFRGRSLAARLGIACDLAPPAMDAMLLRADTFKSFARKLICIPPDRLWWRLALGEELKELKPSVMPLIFGAVAEREREAAAADWQTHALSLMERGLLSLDAAPDQGSAVSDMLDLAARLACCQALSPSASGFLSARFLSLAEQCMARRFAAALQKPETMAAFQLSLCEVLGIEGVDSLELSLDDAIALSARRLGDFVELTSDRPLAQLVSSVLAGAWSEPSQDLSAQRSRDLLARLMETERELKHCRATAASTLERLQILHQKRRLARASEQNEPETP